MKKPLIILTFFCLINLVESQPYFDSTSFWHQKFADYGSPCAPRIKYYNYFISGDTSINGKNYYKIYSSGVDSCWGNATYFYNVYSGCIREDSNKNLYFVPSTTEELLCHFDYNLNDTILPNTFYNLTCTLIVTDIDTFYLGSSLRKKYSFNNSSLYAPLYEGIGSARGLFGNYCPMIDAGSSLYCFSQDNNAILFNPNLSCGIVTNENSNFVTQVFFSSNVFPNPFSESTTIKIFNRNNLIYDFKLYDIFGRLIIEKNRLTEDEIIIDNNVLSSGIFLYQISNDNKILSKGKLIKLKI